MICLLIGTSVYQILIYFKTLIRSVHLNVTSEQSAEFVVFDA